MEPVHTTNGKLKKLHEEDGGKCLYCASPTVLPKYRTEYNASDGASCDHIIPRKFRKKNNNRRHCVVLACRKCNNERDTIDMTKWLDRCIKAGHRTAAEYKAYFQRKLAAQNMHYNLIVIHNQIHFHQKVKEDRFIDEALIRIIRHLSEKYNV